MCSTGPVQLGAAPQRPQQSGLQVNTRVHLTPSAWLALPGQALTRLRVAWRALERFPSRTRGRGWRQDGATFVTGTSQKSRNRFSLRTRYIPVGFTP